MTAQQLTPIRGNLTLDDLERLAFKYGGSVEVDLSTGAYWLRNAVIAGTSVNLGPVFEVTA